MKLLSKVATALLCAEAAVSACAADDYPSNAVVLYASVAPHSPQLYIAKGDGSDARPLLADARYDYNASLSADSQWVVFTSEREGSPDIYRARIDGSEVERLTNDPAFDDAGTLSPDGKFLAFVSTRETGNANIWVLEMATGKLTNLTAG